MATCKASEIESAAISRRECRGDTSASRGMCASGSTPANAILAPLRTGADGGVGESASLAAAASCGAFDRALGGANFVLAESANGGNCTVHAVVMADPSPGGGVPSDQCGQTRNEWSVSTRFCDDLAA